MIKSEVFSNASIAVETGLAYNWFQQVLPLVVKMPADRLLASTPQLRKEVLLSCL